MSSPQYQILIMIQVNYKDARQIQSDSPFFDFRPSGPTRMLKGPFQYSAIATAISYGILFNGFGLHSYYLQRTGTTFNYLPWARTKAIASTFGKYLAITLPFFYFKQLYTNTMLILTRGKPKIRKYFLSASLQNIFAMTMTFPIFYLFQRNLIKSARGCLMLGVFSMVTDVFIQYKRREMILRKYDRILVKQKQIENNLDLIKRVVSYTSPDAIPQLQKINWTQVKDEVMAMNKKSNQIEKNRQQQIKLLSQALEAQFNILTNIFK